MLKKYLLLIAALVLFSGCAAEKTECGALTVRVSDGFSGTPVEGAVISVPEAGATAVTDVSGIAAMDGLPVIGDSEYDRLLENPEGRITLLVTKEGYTPYLLLYARLTPGRRREVEILLFPDDGSLPVFTVIEAPDGSWCRELAEKYGGTADVSGALKVILPATG